MSDYERIYFNTRDIYLGKKQMKKVFQPFVDWFENKYRIHLLNVETHYNPSGHELDLWFTTEEEKIRFCSTSLSFPDQVYVEEIRAAFNEVMGQNFKNRFFYSIFSNVTFSCKYLLFLSLEDYEKRCICEKLSQQIIDDFVKTLDNKAIWTIAPELSFATLFLHTNVDVEKFRDTEIVKEWKGKYFNFLKTFDPLNMYKKESFYLQLNSKENFDTIYGGNWYHFYK